MSPLTNSSLFALNLLPAWLRPLFQKTFPWETLANLVPLILEQVEEGTHTIELHPSVVIEGQVYIDKEAIIEPQCYIRGPAWIGKGVTVRQGAYIRGNVLALEGAVIGHCTEVKNTIFLPGAKAGHFAYIGDSILGIGVNLGAGTRLANLRLDRKEISFKWQNEVYETNKAKCGAFIGDGCQIGCNSVLNPGTILGKNSLVWPLVACGGVFSAQAKIEKST